ncbi:MAG: hypothetical protein C4583_03250 [Anaerolineaceae bacterium]|nr:MAG: hypothetical protein C4583_03250 [Anaerolineaceae bacterium]
MGFSGLECSHKPTLPEKPYFFNLDLAKVLLLDINSSKAKPDTKDILSAQIKPNSINKNKSTELPLIEQTAKVDLFENIYQQERLLKKYSLYLEQIGKSSYTIIHKLHTFFDKFKSENLIDSTNKAATKCPFPDMGIRYKNLISLFEQENLYNTEAYDIGLIPIVIMAINQLNKREWAKLEEDTKDFYGFLRWFVRLSLLYFYLNITDRETLKNEELNSLKWLSENIEDHLLNLLLLEKNIAEQNCFTGSLCIAKEQTLNN